MFLTISARYGSHFQVNTESELQISNAARSIKPPIHLSRTDRREAVIGTSPYLTESTGLTCISGWGVEPTTSGCYYEGPCGFSCVGSRSTGALSAYLPFTVVLHRSPLVARDSWRPMNSGLNEFSYRSAYGSLTPALQSMILH